MAQVFTITSLALSSNAWLWAVACVRFQLYVPFMQILPICRLTGYVIVVLIHPFLQWLLYCCYIVLLYLHVPGFILMFMYTQKSLAIGKCSWTMRKDLSHVSPKVIIIFTTPHCGIYSYCEYLFLADFAKYLVKKATNDYQKSLIQLHWLDYLPPTDRSA